MRGWIAGWLFCDKLSIILRNKMGQPVRTELHVNTQEVHSMNHILEALSEDSARLLRPLLTTVDLEANEQLELPNRNIHSVYFLETGVAVVMAISDSESIATGLIGCEGASGVNLFLGDTKTPNLTKMLTNGRALKANAEQIRVVLKDRELHNLLTRYALAYFNQAEHTAFSNALTSVQQRLIRWLLMTHDRVPENTIPMTHDTMAFMMGIRRAGVTEALHELARKGLIALYRGAVEILNRAGLEQIAGHFYGLPEREFVRLVGTPWPPMPKLSNSGHLESSTGT
jgi:CRP-like cAMP-binding protein